MLTEVSAVEVPGPEFGGVLLVRNISITLFSYVASGVALLLISPRVIHALGVERYGLLALMLAVVGYVRQDFGLANSTTRTVAAAIGTRDDALLPTILWTAMASAVVLGATFGLVLFAISPLLVNSVLTIQPALRGEALHVLWVSSIALGLPVLIEPLRGTLAAYQRFALLNSLRVCSSLATSLILLAGETAGYSLAWMVSAIAVKDCIAWAAHWLACRRIIPISRAPWRPDPQVIKELFSFGGWLTVYQMARLAIQYAELPVSGAVLTMSAVGFYAAPAQLIGMLALIPAAIIEVTFPAYCALHAAGSVRFQQVFRHVMQYQTVLVGLIAVLLFTFAPDILRLWLGSGFDASVWVLRVQALTFLLGALATVFIGVLHGAGLVRPTAVILMIVAPIQVAMLYVFSHRAGIAGAATAGAVSQALVIVAYAAMCARHRVIDVRAVMAQRGLPFLGAMGLLVFVIAKFKSDHQLPLTALLALAMGITAVYVGVGWLWVLSGDERRVALHSRDLAFAKVWPTFGRRSTVEPRC